MSAQVVARDAWELAVGSETPSAAGESAQGTYAAGSFEAHFGALHARAYRVGYRVLGSASAAEDVAAEALARAYSRWRSIADRAEPWVARVAYNLAVDELRRQQRSRRHETADERSVDPHSDVRLDVLKAISTLPRRTRHVVVLRYLADQSEDATAAELGLSSRTVARHAATGLEALRAQLAHTAEGN